MNRHLADVFRDRSVFVTGHTGFKGSWLCQWLHELGAWVSGYALAPPTQPSNYVESDVAASLVVDHRGDLRDTRQLSSALRASRPEVIFHLAAQSTVMEGYQSPRETFETNVMGTIALLEAMRDADRPCAVVIVSSDKCYENREQVWGYRETDQIGGRDPYSASKGAMELAVASYRSSFFPPDRLDRHGIKLATVRAGNVIGGGDWTPNALITDTIEALRSGRSVTLRNPDAVRPWQFVLEPLHGYLQLAARMLHDDDPQWCDAWNFGPYAGQEYRVSQLVEWVIAAWGNGRWLDGRESEQPPEARQLRLTIDKALWQLNWRPRWELREAVQQTVQWYRSYYNATANERRSVAGELCRRQIQEFASPHNEEVLVHDE